MLIFSFGFLIGFIYTFLAFTSVMTVTQITVKYGFRNGLAAGLGHTTAQIIWAAIALVLLGLGMQFTGEKVQSYRYIGALFLILIAAKLCIVKDSRADIQSDARLYFKDFLTVFSIAITAPIRILGYFALFALIRSVICFQAPLDPIFVLLGSLAGTLFWWSIYCSLISQFNVSPTNKFWHHSHKWIALLLLLSALAVFF